MALGLPFDPIQRSEEAEKLVMRGDRRLYYKFRAAPYCGGIATADAVGCSFLCACCWNYGRNENPARFGKFFSPEDVADNLLKIARRFGRAEINELRKTLVENGIQAELELERLEAYPFVLENMRERGVSLK